MMREHLKDNSLVVQLEGDFILNNGSLYTGLAEAIKKYDRKRIVLDLSALERLDECSVKGLLRLVEKYSARGYHFSILGPRKSILKQLVDTDVVDRVEIRNTLQL